MKKLKEDAHEEREGEVRKRKEGGKKGKEMKINKNKNKILIHIVFFYIYRISLGNRRSDDLRSEKEIRGLGNGGADRKCSFHRMSFGSL